MQPAHLLTASLLVATVGFFASSPAAPPVTAPSAARTDVENRQVADKEGEHVDAVIRAYFAGPAGSAYGGSYLDDQGRSVLLVTHDMERIRRDLRARVGDSTQLLIRPARFTLRDLDRIVDRLSARLDTLRAAGAPVTVVAVDEEANHVWVGFEADSPSAREVVLAAVGQADRAAIAFGTSGINVLK